MSRQHFHAQVLHAANPGRRVGQLSRIGAWPPSLSNVKPMPVLASHKRAVLSSDAVSAQVAPLGQVPIPSVSKAAKDLKSGYRKNLQKSIWLDAFRVPGAAIVYCALTRRPLNLALGHVWTAPWQELSDVSAALVGAVTCPACWCGAAPKRVTALEHGALPRVCTCIRPLWPRPGRPVTLAARATVQWTCRRTYAFAPLECLR